MNLSASAMLVNKAIRPVRVEYDPDNKYNNNGAMTKFFKCLDPTVAKDDLVVVETTTRHSFTIAKVVEIDFPFDFNDPAPWGWIAQKFNVDAFKKLKETEKLIIGRVAKAQENKMRRELAEAHGLGEVEFDDLELMAPVMPQAGAIEHQAKTPEPPVETRARHSSEILPEDTESF